jgi:putative oxidoreductase
MTLSARTNGRIVWAVRVLLALAFGAAGIAKLASAPQMIQIFDLIGVGQWFRYVTGIVEFVGALLLLVPRTGFIGGLLLAVTMVCAVATHLFVIGGNPVPAIVLALLSAFVAYRLRPIGEPDRALYTARSPASDAS